MQKFAFIMASLLFCGGAQAASVVCTGSMLDYQFTVRAKTSGTKVAGKASIVATKGGAVRNQGNIPITSSQFVPGQTLNFTAQAADSSVQVSTRFAGEGRYEGTMALSGTEGSTNVAAVCLLR